MAIFSKYVYEVNNSVLKLLSEIVVYVDTYNSYFMEINILFVNHVRYGILYSVRNLPNFILFISVE